MYKTLETEMLMGDRQADLRQALRERELISRAHSMSRPDRARRERGWQLKLTTQYARYALAALATIGFGVSMN